MKIMIVDDSTYMCLFCRQILTEAGYEVVGEAHDGVSATSQAMVLEPDVILMDMALPKKNGMEAAELILQNQANVKIIAMSAIEEDWIGQKAIESYFYFREYCLQCKWKPNHFH